MDFVLSIPANAFAAIAELFKHRANRRKLGIDLVIVSFNDRHVGRGFAGNQVTFAVFPVFRFKGLTELARRVVHQRCQHQIFACAQIWPANFTKLFS